MLGFDLSELQTQPKHLWQKQGKAQRLLHPSILMENCKKTIAALQPFVFLPPQETALECHFGTDRTFEARWVNSSAVECVHVLVSRGCSCQLCLGAGLEGSEGLAPEPPTQQLGPFFPSPTLHCQLKKAQSRLTSPTRGSLRLPMAGRAFTGRQCCISWIICSSFNPCSSGVLGRSCLFYLF